MRWRAYATRRHLPLHIPLSLVSPRFRLPARNNLVAAFDHDDHGVSHTSSRTIDLTLSQPC